MKKVQKDDTQKTLLRHFLMLVSPDDAKDSRKKQCFREKERKI